EKTVCRNPEHKRMPFTLPNCFKNITIIRKNIRIRLRKTLKIIILKQNLTGFVHLFYIQRIEIIPTQILSKNVFLLVDVIMISSSYGIKTSMCLVMNFKNRKNSNILRQKRIEFFDNIIRNLIGKVKMSIHLGRMHSAVRTSCPYKLYRLLQQKRQSLCQCLLYRSCIGLRLPPVIVFPVI